MTTQGFLTLLAELIAIGSIALYGSLFLDGLMKRNRTVPGQLEIDFNAIQQPEQEPERMRLNHVVLPFVRPVRQQPQPIDLSPYSIRQLKAIASAVKLPRYNVEPKANLAARLVAEVERDRLLEVMGAIAA